MGVFVARAGDGVGNQAATFFFETILNRSESPVELGLPLWYLMIGLILTWGAIYHILRKGVKNVSKVVLFTVPLPLILLAVILVRGLTLPGAMDGIRHYLTPDSSKLAKPGIWLRTCEVDKLQLLLIYYLRINTF